MALLPKVEPEQLAAVDPPIIQMDTGLQADPCLDLKGHYQSKNIVTVIQTIKELQKIGYHITHNQIKAGLLKVKDNTGLMGRWQELNINPKVICDTGHNKEGLTYVMNQISNEVFENLHIVFGVVNDKDLNSIIDILPKKATYYFCKPDIPRGLEADILKKTFTITSGGYLLIPNHGFTSGSNGAEYVLKWLPIGTHDWEKFVKPEDLTEISKRNKLLLKKLDGMQFNILNDSRKVSDDTSVNYITKFIKT